MESAFKSALNKHEVLSGSAVSDTIYEQSCRQQLINRLNNKTAHVAVIGLGHVGLPLLLRIARQGFSVIGLDANPARLAELRCQLGLGLPPAVQMTNEYAAVARADILIICVPTPLSPGGTPDLSHITGTMEALAPFLRRGQALALESTSYPGTCEEELLPRISTAGLAVGTDFFLIYSPERVDPGNLDWNVATIPKVCSGYTPACLDVAMALYTGIVEHVVPVASIKVAEMAKLLENVQRAVNIGLVNEMKMLADKMDIDIHQVIAAAATKPFGFTPYYPGPGVGGHCIPVDPLYLSWKAREYGMATRFVDLACEVNAAMPHWVVGKFIAVLAGRGQNIHGCRVIVLGVTYKKDVADIRASPAFEIIKLLKQHGALVSYIDPYVACLPQLGECLMHPASLAFNTKTLRACDCVFIVTPHRDFDYALIKDHAPLVVDTCGVYRQPFDTLISA